MNSPRKTLAAAGTLSAILLALAGPAGADPIAYDQTPLSNIVAQLGQQYGVNIVLKGNLANDPSRPITLHVGDPGTTPTRLQAINALANATGVDFQKGFVVSKMASDDVPPPVKVDSNGYVVFKDATVPARDAITEIATTDNATIQISDDVTGNVTLSKSTLRTADAAAEIARQTHTRWRVYYALTPRSLGQRGKVVDRNNAGQAIVELPFTYYGSKTRPDETAAGTGTTPTTGAPNPGVPPVGSVSANNPYGSTAASPGVGFGPLSGNGPYSYVPQFGYGPMPFTSGNMYNFDAFGNPYQTQYGYFGYPGSGGGYSGYGGVNIFPGNGGYGPFGGYGSPVTF